MATKDILYQDVKWQTVNINKYVGRRKAQFDEMSLTTLPISTLKAKLQFGAMAANLLVHDPLRHHSKKRDKLNEAVLKEIRRQLELLAEEYNRRVAAHENRENMGKLEIVKPKKRQVAKVKVAPPGVAQTIGLQTVSLKGTTK